MAGEAGAVGAVDDSMVVGQRQRQHQTRFEALACLVPHRLPVGAREAEDGDFRAVDDRREHGAADAAEAGDGETAALHGIDLELAFARQFGHFGQFLGNVHDILFIDIADHRYHQAIRRIAGKADMEVLLQEQVFSVGGKRCVEGRVGTQGVDHRFHQESQQRQLDAALGGFVEHGFAEVFQVGDVGFVELRDVRRADPVAVQVGAGKLLDARQRLPFDFTEFGKVDDWSRREAKADGFAGGLGQFRLDPVLHVFLEDAAARAAALDLAEVCAQFARESAHRRAGVRRFATGKFRVRGNRVRPVFGRDVGRHFRRRMTGRRHGGDTACFRRRE